MDESSDDDFLDKAPKLFVNANKKPRTMSKFISPTSKNREELAEILASLGVKKPTSAASLRPGVSENKKSSSTAFQALLGEARSKEIASKEVAKQEKGLEGFVIDESLLNNTFEFARHKRKSEASHDFRISLEQIMDEGKNREEKECPLELPGLVSLYNFQEEKLPQPVLAFPENISAAYSPLFEMLLISGDERDQLWRKIASSEIAGYLKDQQIPLPKEIADYLIDIVAFHKDHRAVSLAFALVKEILGEPSIDRASLHFSFACASKIFSSYGACFLRGEVLHQSKDQTSTQATRSFFHCNMKSLLRMISLFFQNSAFAFSNDELSTFLTWLLLLVIDEQTNLTPDEESGPSVHKRTHATTNTHEVELCLESVIENIPSDSRFTVLKRSCAMLVLEGSLQKHIPDGSHFEDSLAELGKRLQGSEKCKDFLRCFSCMVLLTTFPEHKKAVQDYQSIVFSTVHKFLQSVENEQNDVLLKARSDELVTRHCTAIFFLDCLFGSGIHNFTLEDKKSFLERIVELQNRIRSSLDPKIQHTKELLKWCEFKYAPHIQACEQNCASAEVTPVKIRIKTY